MNIEEEIKKCEIFLKQIKQYDPDPFYVNYFFIKYINSIENIINGIFEEANTDFGLFISDKITQKKFHNKMFTYLRKKKIYAQIHYIPIYRQPYFKKNFNFNIKNFPNSEDYYSQAISIPIFFQLTHKKQFQVIKLINSFFKKNR